MKRFLRFYPFFLFIFLGFLTYFPSIFGAFLWDDYDFITGNQYIKQFSIGKFFTAQAVEGAGKVSNYFRPIQFTTYAIIYKIVGSSPALFHVISIVTHICATIALYFFLKTFLLLIGPVTHKTFRLFLIWIPSLIFLIHPIQTEAVTYISGFSDPLVAFFGFSSILLFLRSINPLSGKVTNNKFFLCSIFFFLLALLSKESGIIFLGLYFLVWFLLRYKSKSSQIISSLILLLPHSIATLLYLLYHRIVIDSVDIATTFGDSPFTHSVSIRIATFLSILPQYFAVLIFPKDLFYDRDFTVKILTVPWSLTSTIVLSVLLIVVLVSISALIKRKSASQSFAVIWGFSFVSFFISLIPFSGLTLINGIMYEHFLYIALPFFFLFVLISIHSLIPITTKKSVVIFFFYCLLLVIRSWYRQLDWQDPIRFYTQTLKYVPNSFRVLNNLGLEYSTRGNTTKAIETFEQAIHLNPTLPNPYHNIGEIYLQQKQFSKAEEYFTQAIQIDPTFGYSYASLVSVYQQTGEKEKLKHISEEIIKRFK